jgi:tetratricopeptide (TPR) repeat protein
MTILVLAITGCQALGPKQHKEQAQEYWSGVRARIKARLAQQHLDAGRLDEAVTAADEARALDPRLTSAYEVLAKANLELSRPATAMQAVDAAAALGPLSPKLHYLRGVILEQRGDVEPALVSYSTARRLDPIQVDYLTAEVECLVALDRAAEALARIDEGADRFNESATIAALGGHVAAFLGDTEDALRRFRRAQAAAPQSTAIRRTLGLLLAAGGHCQEAVDMLTPMLDEAGGAAWQTADTAATLDDPSGVVRRALGRCYLTLADPARARDILIGYAARNRDDLIAQVLLAKAALSTGDLFTAAAATQQAWNARPDDVEVLLLRAAVQWQQGRLHDARATLDELLTRAPDDRDAHRLLAAVGGDPGPAAR